MLGAVRATHLSVSGGPAHVASLSAASFLATGAATLRSTLIGQSNLSVANFLHVSHVLSVAGRLVCSSDVTTGQFVAQSHSTLDVLGSFNTHRLRVNGICFFDGAVSSSGALFLGGPCAVYQQLT